jgi:DNA-binding Lrp family transcriptional regulator
MVDAFVLIRISRQREMMGFGKAIAAKLSAITGVETAELLFGEYDAIVKLKAEKIHDLENRVLEEIALVEGIDTSTTLLCVNDAVLQ